MKIAMRIAVWVPLLVALQFSAAAAEPPHSALSGQPSLARRRNEGDECKRRLQKQLEIKKAIREKRVIVGMTENEVRSAWGWPELMHPVHGIDESSDRWTFRRKGQGLVDLYFKNGILVQIGD